MQETDRCVFHNLDAQTLPTLKSLHDAVIAKTEDDSEEYMSLVTHLLRHALDEPGVPNPKEVCLSLICQCSIMFCFGFGNAHCECKMLSS